MMKKQHGVTLVELMISLVLGLAVIAGIGQLFIQSQKSFSLQRGVSEMTEDGSFLLEVLAKGIVQASYSKNDSQRTAFVADSSVLGSTISLGDKEYIHGTDNELVYRFALSDESDLNNFLCTQSLDYGLNDVVTVRLYKDDDPDSAVPTFYCRVKKTGDVRNPEPLISEVQDVVFKYGVQTKSYNATSSPPTRTPENDKFYYTTADNVTDWKEVIAVKIFAVLRSEKDNLTRVPITYDVEGEPYTATDNRAYKVFSKTIFLRGLIQ